jgi:hypothetical protein
MEKTSHKLEKLTIRQSLLRETGVITPSRVTDEIRQKGNNEE